MLPPQAPGDDDMTRDPVVLDLPDWIERDIDTTQVFGDDATRVALAIRLARGNIEHDTGGPFGAALFAGDGRLVAVGVSRVIPKTCSIAHAEIVAFAFAQKRTGRFRLNADG